jgi:hypothetical protein
MTNIIKFFIVGITGIMIGTSLKHIFNKSTKKPITNEIATQTDLTYTEVEQAILCKKDLDAINTGTYEWKFI